MNKEKATRYTFDLAGYSIQDHLDFISLAERLMQITTIQALFGDQSVQCQVDAQTILDYIRDYIQFMSRFLVEPTIAEISLEELPELIKVSAEAFVRKVLGASKDDG